MVDEDLGDATIVYEGPDGDTVEKTVQNEHVAYFQDHWIVRTGEDEEGLDEVRRIPARRVYYVERSVEEFEEEVATLRDQVESFAEDLRSKFLGGQQSGDRGGSPIEVDLGDSDEDEGSSQSDS